MGLFSTKPIRKGEELTIDYKFQRYGKLAQKCFCETPSCRGYIGSREASDIYIDGSKRNKNDELERPISEDEPLDKDAKDAFRIPRLVGPKRPSESSDGNINNDSGNLFNGSNTKRSYAELSTTASILLGNKKFKSDQQQQPPSQQVNPNQQEQNKLAFRIQFELDEYKRKTEEERINYQRQIEFMRQEIERQKQLAIEQSPYFAKQHYLEEPQISWDSQLSYPPEGQSSTLHPALILQENPTYQLSDQTIEYDSFSHLDQLNSFPILTNNKHNHNVLIELSPKDHSLMPDEKAVIQTDYGVEYVPIGKSKKESISKSLFDPSYPPPGVYYECVIQNSVYYVPYPFDSQKYPFDFFATTANAPWPEFNFLYEQIEGPLPRNWRRTCDQKTNRIYYYNKKSGHVSWHFPQGSGLKQKSQTSNGPIGLASKIESIIASADSTSTPPPPLQNTLINTVSQSPPGIFAISNGIEKDSKKSQQAEPDQSLPKKNKQMVFDGRTKKGLDKFKEEITELVKKALNPYRKPDCKVGRIDTNEDFKFLARKVCFFT